MDKLITLPAALIACVWLSEGAQADEFYLREGAIHPEVVYVNDFMMNSRDVDETLQLVTSQGELIQVHVKIRIGGLSNPDAETIYVTPVDDFRVAIPDRMEVRDGETAIILIVPPFM